MKKLTLILILFSIIKTSCHAQNADMLNKHEFYLTTHLNALTNFDLQYKKHLKANSYLRIGLLDLDLDLYSLDNSLSSSYGQDVFKSSVAFQLGIEKRKGITNSTELFIGYDLLASGFIQREMLDNPTLTLEDRITYDYAIQPGIGIALGFISRIGEKLYLAGELEPQLNYRFQVNETSSTTKYTNEGLSLNLSSQIAKVSLVYKL